MPLPSAAAGAKRGCISYSRDEIPGNSAEFLAAINGLFGATGKSTGSHRGSIRFRTSPYPYNASLTFPDAAIHLVAFKFV
jgi:hypothetical protein